MQPDASLPVLRIHSSHLNHPLFVSVIDFHGLEDRVIPYNITSAKGNIVDVHKRNPQRFNNGKKESIIIVTGEGPHGSVIDERDGYFYHPKVICKSNDTSKTNQSVSYTKTSSQQRVTWDSIFNFLDIVNLFLSQILS